MNLFFSPLVGSIPPDSDDIGQSAYVGRMIVRAADLEREKPPFAAESVVRVVPGINFAVVDKTRGKVTVLGTSIGDRRVEKVYFSGGTFRQGSDAEINGWVARLEGVPFAIRCASLVAA